MNTYIDLIAFIICLSVFLYFAVIICFPKKVSNKIFWSHIIKINSNYFAILATMLITQFFLIMIIVWRASYYFEYVYPLILFIVVVIIIIEYIAIAIKVLKYGIVFIRYYIKIDKKLTRLNKIKLIVLFIVFIVATPITFGAIYMTLISPLNLEYVTEHNIHIFHYIYYSFSISFSLPENDIQYLIERNEWVKVLFVTQSILTKVMELVLLGFIASILAKLIFPSR